MANQKQQQVSPEDFSPEEQQQMQHYGQALVQGPTDFDEEVEKELAKHYHEASYQKMRTAQQGLAPSPMEQEQVKQQQALTQQTNRWRTGCTTGPRRPNFAGSSTGSDRAGRCEPTLCGSKSVAIAGSGSATESRSTGWRTSIASAGSSQWSFRRGRKLIRSPLRRIWLQVGLALMMFAQNDARPAVPEIPRV